MVQAVNAIEPFAAGAARGIAATGAAGPAPAVAAPAATGGTDFAAVLGSLVTETAERLRAGEAASLAGIEGRASTQAVVEAVLAAERSLQTTLAVRDKVVAAYQEISRMAI